MGIILTENQLEAYLILNRDEILQTKMIHKDEFDNWGYCTVD